MSSQNIYTVNYCEVGDQNVNNTNWGGKGMCISGKPN